MNLYSLFNKSNLMKSMHILHYYALSYDFFDMELHMHHEWEIMYVVNGECQIFLSMDDNITLRKGNVIFLDAMVEHRLSVPRGTSCRMMNLEVGFGTADSNINIQTLINQYKPMQKFIEDAPSFFVLTDIGTLHPIISSLLAQKQEHIDEQSIIITSLLNSFLLELSAQYQKPSTSNASYRYVRSTLQYLDRYYDEDISISALAKEANISVAHLQRLFSKETGMSIITYLHKKRIGKAKILLENSTLDIVDIAESVGFHSRQHFTSVFRQTTGVTPSKYRLLHRSPNSSSSMDISSKY